MFKSKFSPFIRLTIHPYKTDATMTSVIDDHIEAVLLEKYNSKKGASSEETI